MVKKLPIEEQALLSHVLEEKALGKNFVDPKRDLLRQRLSLYTNVAESDHKVYVRLMRSVIQTMMGLYYTDEITTTFSGRQLGDDEYADNLNNLAQFDQEEMKLPQINYDVQWNRLFYGVGIRVFDYWDDLKKVPVFKSVDPLTWVPDPLGYMDNHRFHGFELEVCDSDLVDSIYFNIDKIQPSNSQELEEKRDEINSSRSLNDTDTQVIASPIYAIYNHYTTVNGKKYLVTLANDDSLIIRCEEIKPVYKEEKEDARNVDYPIVINYFEPFKGDPFGISVPDLLEDKQKSEQLFLNLNRIKAEHEAWGGTFMVDTNIVKNVNDLRQHSFGPKYIKTPGSSGSNPIKEVERGRIGQDAYNMPQIIKGQASADVGLDERSLGVSPTGNMSATENQRVQRNQNIKLVLNNTINQWGEKAFWKLWLRSYYEYFKFNDEKNIKLNNAFGNTITTVKREDIETGENIDIKVINKSQEDEIKEKDKLALLTIAELVLQDPNAPQISKTFAKRQIAKANGLDKEKISVLFPASVEEMDARSQLTLLNDNEELDPDNFSLDEDHLTYLIIYQKAMDTEAKRKAIADRTEYYIASGQNKQLPQEQTGIAGISAQLANQAIQAGQEQGAASLADVATQ